MEPAQALNVGADGREVDQAPVRIRKRLDTLEGSAAPLDDVVRVAHDYQGYYSSRA